MTTAAEALEVAFRDEWRRCSPRFPGGSAISAPRRRPRRRPSPPPPRPGPATLEHVAAPGADPRSVGAGEERCGAAHVDAPALADDRLRLLFLCCHPALAPDARIALTLRMVAA